MHYLMTKGILRNRTRAYKMRAHALPQDKWVSYVTELEHTRCARMHYPRTKVSYVTELEHTRCARMHYPRSKGILCNSTSAYKMRAHALPQVKGYLM